MRDAILVPQLYERFYKGNYELLRHDDPRAEKGADTIACGELIDEKIVRWPERNEPYTAFALEVRSCTVEGRERLGWMSTNEVDYLLYCFSDRLCECLDCYLIDFPQLREWFFLEGEDAWPLTRTTQINQTECRVVPICDVVLGRVKMKRLRLSRPAHYDGGRFIHYCNCGKWGAFGIGKPGHGSSPLDAKWYCAEHRPTLLMEESDGQQEAERR
jgi:hypothetical protein